MKTRLRRKSYSREMIRMTYSTDYKNDGTEKYYRWRHIQIESMRKSGFYLGEIGDRFDISSEAVKYWLKRKPLECCPTCGKPWGNKKK